MPRRSRRAPAPEQSLAGGEIVGLSAIAEQVVYPHVFGNADREVGGVLVGRMSTEGGLPLVTGAIPAISADERRATLTFTQDAWAHVHQVLDRDFPADEQIVGWYHSHPGFGIFLSGHDVFIHENFFASPSQIAFVVDPRARTEGVFAWQVGKLRPLFERPTPSGWVLQPDAGPVIAARVSQLQGTRQGSSLLALLVAGAIGVLAGFGLWHFALDSSTGASSGQAPAKQAFHRKSPHNTGPRETKATQAIPPESHSGVQVIP